MNCIMVTNDNLNSVTKMILQNNSSPNKGSKVMEEQGIHESQKSNPSAPNITKKMTEQGNAEEKNSISPIPPAVEVDNTDHKRPSNHEISPETKRIKLVDSQVMGSVVTASNKIIGNIPVAEVHPPETHTKTDVIKNTVIASTIQESQLNKNCINSVSKIEEEPRAPQEEKNKGAQSSLQRDQKSESHASTVTSSSSSSSNSSGISMAAASVAPSNSSSSTSTSSTAAVSSAPATPGPQAPPSSEPPAKSTLMSHLKMKYSAELEYMLREFRKLERQLLGAKGNGAGIEESSGSRERREKLHSFILHLEDTIRQVEVGCGLEAEGKSTITTTKEETNEKSDTGEQNSTAPSKSSKGKEEEDNVQKLEEHILANLLPVKVRLIKQLAAQQGATKNPIGMPVARRGLQPSAVAQTGTGTFAAAAEERRKQVKAAQEEAEQESLAARMPSTPSQFGNALGGNGSSLTQKLHGATLGSEQRRHGHGVGSKVPSSTERTPVNNAEVTKQESTRKVLYGGMVPGSKQIKSGVSAATGAHKMIIQSPELKATAKEPPSKLEALPACSVADQPLSSHTVHKATQNSNSIAPKGRLKPHEDPNLSIEERRKLRKERRKRKKARDLRRREKERQRQLLLQQQASQTSQPKGHGKKAAGKSNGAKGVGKKRGPRSVEYICALCSEVYSSTCDYNPWWALASHECPKCRKSQIPRIDITAVANQIEYHPALLAHAEEGAGGGGGMASSTPVPPMSAIHHVNTSHATVKGYPNQALPQNPKLSCYPGSDSEDESDLSELSDAGDLSDASLDDSGVDDDTPLTDGELAELELFGKEYEGPKLTPDHASRLLVLMGHAQTCPGRHKSVKHRDCCNSVKYLMLHARDCPGTTSSFDVCPYPWCRKVKHLMYHLVACPRPKDCAICSPIALSNNLQNLIGLNTHRRKKHKERMKAVMAAAAAAAKAKPPPPKVPFVPKTVKPTAYRPITNQKKPTTVVSRPVKSSNVRPVPVAAPRVTQIPRNGIKIGAAVPKVGSKSTNGVVVKSLVKPAGKSSMVVVNCRSQRSGQPKQFVNTIQQTSVAKPTVAVIPELTGTKPTVAELPCVELLDPSYPEKISTAPESNQVPLASSSTTVPVQKFVTQDQSKTEVSTKGPSDAVESCVATQAVLPVNTIERAAEVPTDEAIRLRSSKEPAVSHHPGSLVNTVTCHPAPQIVNAHKQEVVKSVQETPTELLHPYEIECHNNNGTNNPVPAFQAVEAAVQFAEKETEVIDKVEDAARKEPVLHQSLIAANVQADTGSVANSVNANPLPQADLTVHVSKQTAKVEVKELIPTGVIENAQVSATNQPPVVANVQSDTGSGTKNVTAHPMPQAALTVNTSQQTANVEAKELVPTGVIENAQVSATNQPPVVANVQSDTRSVANSVNANPLPQADLTGHILKQTAHVEVKELILTGAIENAEESATNQPSATSHPVREAAPTANESTTAQVIQGVHPAANKETVAHQPPLAFNVRSKSGNSMKNVPDHPAPKAALAVHALEQAAKVAMEVSKKNGMSNKVQTAVSKEAAIHLPIVAVNAKSTTNNNHLLPAPINTPTNPVSIAGPAALGQKSEQSVPVPITMEPHGKIASNLPPPRFPEVPVVVKEETV